MLRRARFVIATAICALLAIPLSAGIYYEATTEIQQAGKRDPETYKVQSWVDGGAGKVVFEGGGHPMLEEGSYLLLRDADQQIYLVDPNDQTYSPFDFAMVFGMLRSLSESSGGLVNFEFQNPESEDLGKEPGEEILGYSTVKAKSRSAYTIETSVLGMDRSMRIDSVTELWAARDLTAPALGMWLRGDFSSTGDEEFDRVLRSPFAEIEGTPLKIVVDSTTTNQKGKAQKSRTTMQVTEMREQSIDPQTFVLPEGYREVPLMEKLGMPEGSAEAGGGNGGGPLGGLKGLFGKKDKKKKKKKD